MNLRLLGAASMLTLGVFAGLKLPSAWAESTSCGSYRFQTVELTNPTVEIVDGQTDEAAEAARWDAGNLTPARVHEADGPDMVGDDRIQLEGIAGYGADVLVLAPIEGQ